MFIGVPMHHIQATTAAALLRNFVASLLEQR